MSIEITPTKLMIAFIITGFSFVGMAAVRAHTFPWIDMTTFGVFVFAMISLMIVLLWPTKPAGRDTGS